MKNLLLLLFFIPCLACSQQKVVYSETVKLKGDFRNHVVKGINKHHKRYMNSAFYNNNVNTKLAVDTKDSIVYPATFIAHTYGQNLWTGNAKFINQGDKILIEVSDLKIVKTSGNNGVGYVNVAADEMAPTKGNLINLESIKKEVYKFFDRFD